MTKIIKADRLYRCEMINYKEALFAVGVFRYEKERDVFKADMVSRGFQHRYSSLNKDNDPIGVLVTKFDIEQHHKNVSEWWDGSWNDYCD